MLNGKYARFRYETRDSSSDFCTFLINDEILSGFDRLSETKQNVSEYLKDNSNFLWGWQFDPTIQAMLTMLDAIQKEFSECDNAWFKERYQILIDQQTISFHLYELNNTLPADTQYIRMNQRGLKLTDYENFKASFLGFLHTLPRIEEALKIDLREFSRKLDNEWIDYFWKRNRDKNPVDTVFFDKQLMFLLRVCIEFFYVTSERCRESNGRNTEDLLLEAITNRKEPLTFFNLKKLGFFDAGSNIWQMIIDFQDIMKILLELQKGSYRELFDGLFKRLNLILEGVAQKDSFSREEQVNCFAIFYYMLRVREKISEDEFEIYFPVWQRIITNITHWSDYAHPNQMVNAINTINEFLTHSDETKDFAKFVRKNPECPYNKKSTGLHLTQWFEEHIKENLRCLPEWRTAIDEAEKLFDGQIILLLEYSGIFSPENGKELKFQLPDQQQLEDFIYYRDALYKFLSLWDKNTEPKQALAIENIRLNLETLVYPFKSDTQWLFNISLKSDLQIDLSRTTNKPLRDLLKSLLKQLRPQELSLESIANYIKEHEAKVENVAYAGFITCRDVFEFTGEKLSNRYDQDTGALYLIPQGKAYLRNGFREYNLSLLAKTLKEKGFDVEWIAGSWDYNISPALKLSTSIEITYKYDKFICTNRGSYREGNKEEIIEFLGENNAL